MPPPSLRYLSHMGCHGPPWAMVSVGRAGGRFLPKLGNISYFVTPTILYGCVSWTLTQELENRLRRTQRQMMRMILGSTRRRTTQQDETPPNTNTTPPNTNTTPAHKNDTPAPTNEHNSNSDTDSDADDVESNAPEQDQPANTNDEHDLEPWADWIQRCTHEAEAQMKTMGLEDWVAIQRRRKWRWARRVATESLNKWTLKALTWDPTLDARYVPRRRPALTTHTMVR